MTTLARLIFGPKVGRQMEDAVAREFDHAILHGTKQENEMTDDYTGPKPMPRPDQFAAPVGADVIRRHLAGDHGDCRHGWCGHIPRPQPTPPPDDLNEAERLGLLVGQAYGTALAERDQARDLAAMALSHLKAVLETTPEGTFAATNTAQDQAREWLATVESAQTPD